MKNNFSLRRDKNTKKKLQKIIKRNSSYSPFILLGRERQYCVSNVIFTVFSEELDRSIWSQSNFVNVSYVF